MSDTLSKTIERIRDVILDANTERMNKSTLVGFLGELIVLKKLREEGLNCTAIGNQSGHDIEVEQTPKGILKIDVKASRLKDEFVSKTKLKNWGWALKHKSKKKPISCTHFICVAFTNVLSVKSFYVIPKNKYGKFPHGTGQFSAVENGFVIFTSSAKVRLDRNLYRSKSKKRRNGNKMTKKELKPFAEARTLFDGSFKLLHDRRSVLSVNPSGSLSKALLA
jgi:hypothetical protein